MAADAIFSISELIGAEMPSDGLRTLEKGAQLGPSCRYPSIDEPTWARADRGSAWDDLAPRDVVNCHYRLAAGRNRI